MHWLWLSVCAVAVLFAAFASSAGAGEYKHPGVYVEEAPSRSNTIEGVNTNTTPFTAADNRAAQVKPTGPVVVIGPGMQRGINYFGSDYKHVDNITNITPAQCQTACKNETRCEAWTWVYPGKQGPGPMCWLKDHVPAQSANACCISGVKTQVPGAAPMPPKAIAPIQPKAAAVPGTDQQALGGAPSTQVLSSGKAPMAPAARPSSRIENKNPMAQQPLQIGTASLPAQVRTDPLEISGVALPREPLQIKTGSLEVTGLALPVQLRTDSLEMSGIGLPLQLKTAALEVTGLAVPVQLQTMALEVTGMGVPTRLATEQMEITGGR